MQRIKIDFDNPGLPKRLDVMENDAQSRFFEAELYRGGKAYSAPSGATYSIMYHGFGPQNEGWYDTINDGAGKRAACTVSGNVVTCELARQALQVPGHMTVILCVTASNGYMLKGWPITANVRNDDYNDGEEVEMYFNLSGNVSNSIDQLEKAIAEAEQAKKDIETKAADALASIPEDYTELDSDVKQIKEDLVYAQDNYLGRFLNVEIGYFHLTDFYGGNSQLSSAKTEIIDGNDNAVILNFQDGIVANIAQLVSGETEATYLQSGVVGKNIFTLKKNTKYRIVCKKTDGSNFTNDTLPKIYYESADTIDFRLDNIDKNIVNNTDTSKKSVIDEILVFDENTTEGQLSNYEFINGSFSELSVGSDGLFVSSKPDRNIIIAKQAEGAHKRISLNVIDKNAFRSSCLVGLNESANKAQFIFINNGSIYLVSTSANYKNGNYSKKLGTLCLTDEYTINIYGSYAIVTDSIGQRVKVDGLIYPSDKIGLVFTSTQSNKQSIKAFKIFKEIDRNKISLDWEINNTNFANNGCIRYSYASANKNAIKTILDVANPYYVFNCDKSFGEADIGSNRYRSEVAITLHTELIAKGKLSYECMLPSELNEIDNTTDDIIMQLHDGGNKYLAYSLAPPICIAINNGKICLYLAYNKNEPTSQGDWTQIKYELCDAIYDEWFKLELEYQSAYTKYANPYTIVKINGKVVANTKSLNGMKMTTPCYIRFGLYERQWGWLEPNAPSRTIYIRNVEYEV